MGGRDWEEEEERGRLGSRHGEGGGQHAGVTAG